MNDEISPAETGKSGLGRKLGLALAAFLVLLVVLYFVVSSGAFLKGFILPRVAKAMNMDITVADASLSPFSQLTLDKLKVQAPGAEPLITADQVRVRYRLFSILGGNYVVDELTLAAPSIQIVKEPNGTSNLDPLTKKTGSSGSRSSSSSSGPLRLAVKNVALKDGTLVSIEKGANGAVKRTELTHLNFSVDRLENGQSGKATLASALKIEQRPAAGKGGTNDLMEGNVDGGFDFKLDPQLMPQTVNGKATVALPRAQGAFAELAGLGAVLQADMSPTEVKQLTLRFERGGRALGQVQASGPLDLAKGEGRLKLEVQSIDRQILNFVGASHGWDFADSTINSTNSIDLARQGEVIGAKGQVTGRAMSIRQQGQSTPPVDLDLDYDVTINRQDQTAVIRKLNLAGQQQKKDLLHAGLDKPMTLTWADAARGFAASTFQLGLTNLNLKEWQSVMGTNLPGGQLNFDLALEAKDDGKKLAAKAKAALQDAALRFGTNQIDQAQIVLVLNGQVDNFRTINVDEYNLAVQQAQQPLVKASGSAHYDLSKPDLTLQANAEMALPTWLRLFPDPQLTASNGVVRLSSAIVQKSQKYSATGNLFLADFTGRYGAYAFQDYQTTLNYDVAFEKPALQVRTASLEFRKGYTAGGSVSLTGDVDVDKQAARLTFKLVDLNANAVAPFLAPSLGDKKLVSISLSGDGSAAYDPKGETTLKANLSVTNWVVAAPQRQFTSPVLGAQLQLDGAARGQVMELKQLLLQLSPTPRANNQLLMQAHLDLGKTNASPSQLTVQSESLDVSRYYEMFAGNTATNSASADVGRPVTPKPATPVEVAVPTEPDPVVLPIQQLNADLKIGRLYLREIAITNLQANAKIKGSEVTVRPFDFTVNGGPVAASVALNLGVKGYIYDLSFKADHVPIDPLSVSLTTNAPGTFKGDLFTQADLKGAGVTGPSLQKFLSGKFTLNLTNMTYEIVGQKVKRLLEPIAIALRVPELTQTPLNWVGANVELGKGQIDLQSFTVQSQAFFAESKGTVPMAPVLTNSPLNLPVVLSLRRTLAEKANLLAANSPTNAFYAPLPNFVTVTGTLGDPKSDINKLVLGGLLAKSIGGLVPMGGKAGTILQGLGGALSGQGAAPAGTNAPAATNNPAGNLVQGISGLFNQPKKSTNSAAPATNNAAKPSISDLLKLIPQKK